MKEGTTCVSTQQKNDAKCIQQLAPINIYIYIYNTTKHTITPVSMFGKHSYTPSCRPGVTPGNYNRQEAATMELAIGSNPSSSTILGLATLLLLLRPLRGKKRHSTGKTQASCVVPTYYKAAASLSGLNIFALSLSPLFLP